MADVRDDPGRIFLCRDCGADTQGSPTCPSCGAVVELADVRIEVVGTSATEVEQVALALVNELQPRALTEDFLTEVDKRIDDPRTPDADRGRLRALRDTAGSVSKDVLGKIIARLIEHQAGL